MQSVGQNGVNVLADVKLVQEALNRLSARIGIHKLSADGRCGPKTIDAILRLQKIIHMPQPNGLVVPGGKTAEALDLKPGVPQSSASTNLSGGAWWRANQARWPNENRVEALGEPFRGHVTRFLAALNTAGARVHIGATTRSMTRALLMRYSWDVSKGTLSPSRVPAIQGVDIQWDHGDLHKSMTAAHEMVALFQIAKQPSLTSNHLKGVAIDMTISWTGTLAIAKADGKAVTIAGSPRDGTNRDLQAVGATYGVLHKLPDDPPHWSTTGF